MHRPGRLAAQGREAAGIENPRIAERLREGLVALPVALVAVILGMGAVLMSVKPSLEAGG